MVSNEGPKASFIPFALPIFGEYNDYGTLENIEEDCNTKAIEKYFGCTIQQFVDRCCRPFDDEKAGNKNMPKRPLGMFVHRDVYDYLASTQQSKYRDQKNTTAWNSVDVTDHVLRTIGFVEGEKYERPEGGKENYDKERYNRPFTHPDIPNFIVWSDGTWIRVQIGDKNMDGDIYHPDALEKFLRKQGLPVPEEIYQFRDRLDYDVIYDDELNEREKNQRMQETLFTELKASFVKKGLKEKEAEKEAKRLLFSFGDLRSRHCLFRFAGRYAEEDTFGALYGDLLYDLDFKLMVVAFKSFESNLWAVNAPYEPSWNGYQCGCHNANYNLAKLVIKILDAQWQKDREYDDENRWWMTKHTIKQWWKKWWKKQKDR